MNQLTEFKMIFQLDSVEKVAKEEVQIINLFVVHRMSKAKEEGLQRDNDRYKESKPEQLELAELNWKLLE